MNINKHKKINTALTIAGSDCSGGAGVQADIKTMTALGVYAMSAITSLTAQNTMGVADIMDCSPEFLSKQLDCVFTDIFPNAVKVGMVSSVSLVEVIADKLVKYNARNIVLDPVMVSTSGARLIDTDAVRVLEQRLMTLADVITPNVPETEVLCGTRIASLDDMTAAGCALAEKYGTAVLVKGGHMEDTSADDVLCFSNGTHRLYRGERVNNTNTHGTGCTLSSAIASYLAKGESVENAVRLAKEYLTRAIGYGLDLGKGRGPLFHAV